MIIIYVSSVCSEKVIDFIFKDLTDKSGIAIQKFHRLLLMGFANDKSIKISTLSTIPVSPGNHKKRVWNLKSDEINGIDFNYVPMLNLPFLKNTIVFFYSFYKFLFWKFPNKKKDINIFCDVLSLSISAAALLAFKIRGIKIIGIVTDIPGINVRKENLLLSWIAKMSIYIINKYDGYVLLTKQMNSIANHRNKPFIIMEGLVDAQLAATNNLLQNKGETRILLYAGGLYEQYGIKNLIEAFMKLDQRDIRLYLFGTGPMEKGMNNYMGMDSRICFYGVVTNASILQHQLAATLLVNPRPSKEEFAKYSFPSKNMEYLSSGTPMVTCLLPGMPEEYLPFVYLFEDESTNGIYNTLNILLEKPIEELHSFGLRSKRFVLQNKNNIIQARRITTFIENM